MHRFAPGCRLGEVPLAKGCCGSGSGGHGLLRPVPVDLAAGARAGGGTIDALAVLADAGRNRAAETEWNRMAMRNWCYRPALLAMLRTRRLRLVYHRWWAAAVVDGDVDESDGDGGYCDAAVDPSSGGPDLVVVDVDGGVVADGSADAHSLESSNDEIGYLPPSVAVDDVGDAPGNPYALRWCHHADEALLHHPAE